MINTKEFKTIIERAKKYTGSRSVQSVLQNCCLRLHNNTLTIKATDLVCWYENSISFNSSGFKEGKTTVNSNVFYKDETLETTVNCASLLKIINQIQDNYISLHYNEDNNVLEIKTLKATYKLPCIAASEFPVFKTEDDWEFVNVFETETLKKINIATSTAGLGNVLSAINYKSQTNTLCALDGNMLVYCSVKKEAPFPSPEAIINISGNVINKLYESYYRVFATNEYIKFQKGHEIIITDNMIGKFPTYEQLIPQNNNESMEFKSAELNKILKALEVTLNKYTNIIIFDFIKNAVTSHSPDTGETEVKLDCDKSINTEKISRIAFNWRYVKKLLTLGKTIKFNMDSELSGVLLTYDNDFKALLMPVQID